MPLAQKPPGFVGTLRYAIERRMLEGFSVNGENGNEGSTDHAVIWFAFGNVKHNNCTIHVIRHIFDHKSQWNDASRNGSFSRHQAPGH
mmetsp:Transcript_25022/g.50944  ORF Transcript_25022/g.50944 Transcript_25022/m.50944 type:complete len:88 (+) Transcript_25022:912-1175(+)